MEAEELAKHLATEHGLKYYDLVRLGFEIHSDALGTQAFWMKIAVRTLEVLGRTKSDEITAQANTWNHGYSCAWHRMQSIADGSELTREEKTAWSDLARRLRRSAAKKIKKIRAVQCFKHNQRRKVT